MLMKYVNDYFYKLRFCKFLARIFPETLMCANQNSKRINSNEPITKIDPDYIHEQFSFNTSRIGHFPSSAFKLPNRPQRTNLTTINLPNFPYRPEKNQTSQFNPRPNQTDPKRTRPKNLALHNKTQKHPSIGLRVVSASQVTGPHPHRDDTD